jgi:hypothetical protein
LLCCRCWNRCRECNAGRNFRQLLRCRVLLLLHRERAEHGGAATAATGVCAAGVRRRQAGACFAGRADSSPRRGIAGLTVAASASAAGRHLHALLPLLRPQLIRQLPRTGARFNARLQPCLQLCDRDVIAVGRAACAAAAAATAAAAAAAPATAATAAAAATASAATAAAAATLTAAAIAAAAAAGAASGVLLLLC